MTTRLRARDLLWFTRDVLEEMRNHLERENWNGAVRRGQEVLESSLKAVILQLGADYPKTHDPAPAVQRILDERGAPFDRARLDSLKGASKELADLRAPAGYVEVLCTEEQARRAAAAAEDAFRLAVEHCGEPPEGAFRPGR